MTDEKVAKLLAGIKNRNSRAIGRAISLVENDGAEARQLLTSLDSSTSNQNLIIGITGPPGAGKSTLTSRLIDTLRKQDIRVGIIAVDPSSPLSGGALLGDRVRMMNHSLDPDVVVRSMATRGRLGGLCSSAGGVLRILMAAGCEIILIETVGIGQSEMDIIKLADLTVMVLAPGFGDDIQAMKAGILEVADLIVINKADQPGADKLVLDITAGARQGDENRIVTTIAGTGKGVVALVEKIQNLAAEYRQKGQLEKRRVRAREYETLERGLEILRPRLAAAISLIKNNKDDPAVVAEKIITSLLKPDCNHG